LVTGDEREICSSEQIGSTKQNSHYILLSKQQNLPLGSMSEITADLGSRASSPFNTSGSVSNDRVGIYSCGEIVTKIIINKSINYMNRKRKQNSPSLSKSDTTIDLG